MGNRMLVKGDFDEFETLHGFEPATIQFESLEPTYPKNRQQTYRGVRIDGRGRPAGSQRAVRIY